MTAACSSFLAVVLLAWRRPRVTHGEPGESRSPVEPLQSVTFETRLLGDLLSDYRINDLSVRQPKRRLCKHEVAVTWKPRGAAITSSHIQAHVHGLSSRSVLDLDDSPTMLRDEEVAGSNPVTPTTPNFDRTE
jgi:hypothetical protein